YAKLVAGANLVTTVGFSSRYADVMQEAREYLGANPVPLALAWWLRRSADDDVRKAESLLWNETCRFVDTLRLFCGEVKRVRALAADTQAEQSSLVAQLEFAAGTIGTLTCANYGRAEPRLEIEFAGEGWSLQFGEGLATLRLAE